MLFRSLRDLCEFLRDEEEQPAPVGIPFPWNVYRPSQAVPGDHVPVQRPHNPLPVVEEVVGVEILVAKIFPDIAVEAVRSGFDGCVDDGPGRVSELCIEIAALQLELLNGVRWGSNCRVASDLGTTVHLDVVVDAVQSEIVLPEVDSVHRKVSTTGRA